MKLPDKNEPVVTLKKIGHPLPEGDRKELFLNTAPNVYHQPFEIGRLETGEAVITGVVKIGNVSMTHVNTAMMVRFGREGFKPSEKVVFYHQ